MFDCDSRPIIRETNSSRENYVLVILMYVSIVGLYIFLMLFIAFYWLDPTFHTFITGKTF